MASTIKPDDLKKMSIKQIRDLYSEVPLKQGTVSDDQKVIIDTVCEMIVMPEHNTFFNRGRVEEIKGFTPVGEYDTKLSIALAIAKR